MARVAVAEIGKRLGRKAPRQVACVAKAREHPGMVSPTRRAKVRRVKATPDRCQSAYSSHILSFRSASVIGGLGPVAGVGVSAPHLTSRHRSSSEPVVDLARWRGSGPSSSRMKFNMIPVTITGGDSQSANSSGDGFLVPKRDLVVGLQTAIRRKWLRICKGSPDASALIEELAAMRMVERDDGRAGFGARRGMHDDLVMATALAWWRVRRAGLAPPIGR